MLAKKSDVVIIGSGVAGLMLAKKLSGLGIKVILIEREEHLSGGPSTRNQGWLHRGTYHATSIVNRDAAIQVSKRCIYGYNQIIGFAPEAVEDFFVESIALLHDHSRVQDVIERWKECEVPHYPIEIAQLKSKYPEINTVHISHAFIVRDLSINTRILYRKLLFECQKNTCEVFTSAQFSFLDRSTLSIQMPDDETIIIEANLYIYAAGYSIKEIFQRHHNIELAVRFWKSHLLMVPKFSQCMAFFLDPGESGMMNHGNYSIIHLNEDAILCGEPNYELIEEKVDNVKSAMSRLTHTALGDKYMPVACIKTDILDNQKTFRDLDVYLIEPLPNHLCCLPGKMTEAPYLTDIVTKVVYERLHDSTISYRPLDTWLHNK